MKRINAATIALLIFFSMCLCAVGGTCISVSTGEADTTEVLPVTDEAGESIIDANNRFAFEMYRNIAKNESGNIFFSPFSITSSMAVALEGARGKTEDEIRSVFHFPDDEEAMREEFLAINDWINTGDSEYQLNVLNALWAEKSYPFLPEYVETASGYYSANTTNLDFINSPEDSAGVINNWVNEKTEGRVANIISAEEITDQTALVLTNAIYLQATWVTQFDDYLTYDADFQVTPEKSVKVKMMKRTDYEAYFRYTETDDMQVLGMPYKNQSTKQLSMIVILPKGNNLSSVENNLDAQTLAGLRADMVSQKVDVYIPKFSLETEYLLSDSLKEMGMPAAFYEETADFSKMDGSGDLYISDVIHKAFVDVYEEGTEAAAATRILYYMAATLDQPPVFAADHPFIFLILDDETGNILFMGRVTDPSGLLPPPSPLETLNWTIKSFDNHADGSPSLALDINGNPHICFCYKDRKIEEIKYAVFDGESWNVETVIGEDGIGDSPSMALDSNGNPHFCYYDETNGDLIYVSPDGRSWKIETVDEEGNVGYYCSLALDSNGNPHVSYFDITTGGVKYAVYNGKSWKIERVENIDAGNIWLTKPSLVLDSDGNPHICYRGEKEVLKYASYDGKSWNIEIVDSEFVLYNPVLALDSNENPCICYGGNRGDVLKYAAFDGKSWNVETVDSRGVFASSLALDSNDEPNIIFMNDRSDLVYAVYDGESWNTATVGDGRYPSLALDNEGNPHVSYYYYSSGLFYAYAEKNEGPAVVL